MRALVAVAALSIALSGCGGGAGDGRDAGDPPSVAPTTESEGPDAASPTETDPPATPREPKELDAAAARKAVVAWLGAMAAGEAARACALQTARFTRSQLERSVKRGLVEPGASCAAVVAVAAQFYEALGIDLAGAEVSRAPSSADRVAFAVVLEGYAALGYALVLTDNGWRVHEDLTFS